VEVQFGAKADNTNSHDPLVKYANKRAEIWGATRAFLEHGGCIPTDIPMAEKDLPTEMAIPTYTFVREDHIQLESKKDMKRRGEASPDVTDALAVTFAYPTDSPRERLPIPLANPEDNTYAQPSPYQQDTSYA
jgi:hypothetical protein